MWAAADFTRQVAARKARQAVLLQGGCKQVLGLYDINPEIVCWQQMVSEQLDNSSAAKDSHNSTSRKLCKVDITDSSVWHKSIKSSDCP